MTRIAIVDYGVGNLLNVQRALAAVGVAAPLETEPAGIDTADALVLPGVGAFGEGMRNLERAGLIPALRRHAERGKPLLGICLGMQLLMDESEEFGSWKGLGLLRGRVLRFAQSADPATRVKVPQIGWNRLRPAGGRSWDGTLLDGLAPGAFAYFVHSYYVDPADPADRLADGEYGGQRFCAVIARRNVLGCQFHPEKSAEAGLAILRSFATGIARSAPVPGAGSLRGARA